MNASPDGDLPQEKVVFPGAKGEGEASLKSVETMLDAGENEGLWEWEASNLLDDESARENED